MWISKDGSRQPMIYPETWRTRGWLLIRKVHRSGVTTANDRRVAMLLLEHKDYAAWHVHADLRVELEGVAYGD